MCSTSLNSFTYLMYHIFVFVSMIGVIVQGYVINLSGKEKSYRYMMMGVAM